MKRLYPIALPNPRPAIVPPSILPIVFYLGAHKGSGIRSILADPAYEGCVVRAYEPCPANYAALYSEFASDDRVEIIPKAVVPNAAVFRAAMLYQHTPDHGSDSLAKSVTQEAVSRLAPHYADGPEHFARRGFESVATTDLCAEFRQLDIYGPAVGPRAIYTDIQGADLSVVKSILPWLLAGSVPTLRCEVDSDALDHYRGFPAESGITTNRLSAWLELFGQHVTQGPPTHAPVYVSIAGPSSPDDPHWENPSEIQGDVMWQAVWFTEALALADRQRDELEARRARYLELRGQD